jgi:hypothetical protein
VTRTRPPVESVDVNVDVTARREVDEVSSPGLKDVDRVVPISRHMSALDSIKLTPAGMAERQEMTCDLLRRRTST